MRTAMQYMAMEEITRMSRRVDPPTREDLAAMPAEALRDYIADRAREHGGQCVDVGACWTSPAWSRMRVALDVLAERAGGVS